jgi:hypothetical protein
MSLSNIAINLQKAMKKHSPEILTGIGIAGMITTTVLAVRATPKALRILEEKWDGELGEEILHSTNRDDFTMWEKVKLTWKYYIPSAIIGGISICCLIGANSVNFRRNTALATAYTLSESALKEYQEKVIETIGKKKEQSVRDSIAKDKLEQDPIINREVIITEKGNTLCYDVISCRYFRSNIDKIKKIENELNRRMRDEMYISLNDFYYELGLNGSSMGEDLGWNIDDGYIDLNFSSQLAEDGTPCLVINYQIAPRYDYRR